MKTRNNVFGFDAHNMLVVGARVAKRRTGVTLEKLKQAVAGEHRGTSTYECLEDANVETAENHKSRESCPVHLLLFL